MGPQKVQQPGGRNMESAMEKRLSVRWRQFHVESSPKNSIELAQLARFKMDILGRGKRQSPVVGSESAAQDTTEMLARGQHDGRVDPSAPRVRKNQQQGST